MSVPPEIGFAGRRAFGLTLLVTVCLVAGCSENAAPDEFEKGFRVVEWWTSTDARTRSAFSFTYPEQKPSQLIAYIFSPMGAAEWPPTEGSGEFSADEEQMIRSSGQPLMPATVAFLPNNPDAERGVQIVLTADDIRMVVVAEAYLDPLQPPVARREYSFK